MGEDGRSRPTEQLGPQRSMDDRVHGSITRVTSEEGCPVDADWRERQGPGPVACGPFMEPGVCYWERSQPLAQAPQPVRRQVLEIRGF